MISERDERLVGKIKVSSAGFIPQKFRDHLAKFRLRFPEPFYNRPMAEITRTTLLKKGFDVPEEWRSKELTPKMVEEADLVITALSEQKEELIRLYRKAHGKIYTIRDMSNWDGTQFIGNFEILPKDDTFWEYIEGNTDYAFKVISLTEETLIRAYPNILKQLGFQPELCQNILT
jgi:hypothetical protein